VEPEQKAAATTARFRAAVEAGDVQELTATLAPDVVLNSPITGRFRFEGPREIGELMASVFTTVLDIRYTDDIGDARTRALFYSASVRGVPVQEATRVRLDEQARISEIVLWFRPMPGLLTLVAALGPKVIRRRRGPLGAAVARVMTPPLLLMGRLADRVGGWLAAPRR
jgi:hypothetical protein